MTRVLFLVGFIAALIVPAAIAATRLSDAELYQQTSVACIAASGLLGATEGPVVRFSDSLLMAAHSVTDTYPQPHTKGAERTMP